MTKYKSNESNREIHFEHPSCECSICRAPTRIQFVCHDRLVAEVIVEHHMADQTQADYYRALRNKSRPIGASVMNRADISRFWSVPVGTKLR